MREESEIIYEREKEERVKRKLEELESRIEGLEHKVYKIIKQLSLTT